MESKSYDARIAELSGYLARRAAAYPARDESHDLYERAADELTESLLADLDLEAFRPDARTLERAEGIADRPIFICGQMKSGTGLLTTLLDSHPELFATPVGTHYLLTEPKFNREVFRDIAIYWMRHVINPTGKEPFWFLGRERRTFESMMQHLYYFLRHTRHDVFVCAALALYSCVERDEPARFWIEKTTQNELQAPELLRRFPKAKFLHVVRDPLTNLASLKRLAGVRDNKFRARKRAQSIRKLFRAGIENRRVMGDAVYRILRYEDLVRDPRAVMQGVAEFLGIRFCESLLTPTENGRPATSNSMYKESRVRGQVLDQSRNRRYLQDLTPGEIEDIITELEDVVPAFGYDWKDVPRPARPWWARFGGSRASRR